MGNNLTRNIKLALLEFRHENILYCLAAMLLLVRKQGLIGSFFWDKRAAMVSLTKISKLSRVVAHMTAVAVSSVVLIAVAQAQSKVYGCNFTSRYNAAQAAWATAKARTMVGAEADTLHKQYIELKRECRSNPNAQRVVQLSPKAASLANRALSARH